MVQCPEVKQQKCFLAFKWVDIWKDHLFTRQQEYGTVTSERDFTTTSAWRLRSPVITVAISISVFRSKSDRKWNHCLNHTCLWLKTIYWHSGTQEANTKTCLSLCDHNPLIKIHGPDISRNIWGNYRTNSGCLSSKKRATFLLIRRVSNLVQDQQTQLLTDWEKSWLTHPIQTQRAAHCRWSSPHITLLCISV